MVVSFLQYERDGHNLLKASCDLERFGYGYGLEMIGIGGPNETGRFSWPKNIRHLLNSPWATGILSVFGVFGEPYDTIRNKKHQTSTTPKVCKLYPYHMI